MEHAIVLDGESRQMRIGDKIAGRLAGAEHLLKEMPVLIGRLNDADTSLIEPTLHAENRLLQCEWALMQARVGADADERGQYWPAKRDRGLAAELFIPPGASGLMVFREAVLGIQENVGVEQDHLWSSPSPRASRSVMLS